MQSRYRYMCIFIFFWVPSTTKKRAEISGTGTFWPITSHWENLVEVDIQFIPMMPFVGHHHGYIPTTKNTLQQPCLKHQQKTGAFHSSVCEVTPQSIMVGPPSKHTKYIHNPKEASRHRLGRSMFWVAYPSPPASASDPENPAHLAEVSGGRWSCGYWHDILASTILVNYDYKTSFGGFNQFSKILVKLGIISPRRG